MSLESTRDDRTSKDAQAPQAYEAELIAGLRRGDTYATTRVFNLYFDRLYSMVFYAVGKDREVAEDITQETFVSAFKAARKFRANSSLYTWLAGIANHKVADYFRHLNKERKHIKSLSASPVFLSPETDSGIDKILDTFPVVYRQVLLLKYVEDMSVAEISQVMRKTEKSIEGLLARARKMLRDEQEKLKK